ncbi:hypothetical protein Hanom_Chr01g00020341 [Helianthus anomalus]
MRDHRFKFQQKQQLRVSDNTRNSRSSFFLFKFLFITNFCLIIYVFYFWVVFGT